MISHTTAVVTILGLALVVLLGLAVLSLRYLRRMFGVLEQAVPLRVLGTLDRHEAELAEHETRLDRYGERICEHEQRIARLEGVEG